MARRSKTNLTHSDVVRQRRAHQSQKRVDRKMQRAHSVPATRNTSTYIRRGTVGTPILQRTKTNVKRKYTLPLNNGSEVMMPSLPILKPGWRLLSGFITITLFVFLSLILFSSTFNVSSVVVHGPQRIKPADIQSILNLSEKPIFSVNPDAIQETLKTAFPELYDIEIKVELPSVVSVIAKERQPVLAWQYDNLIVWIDPEGYLFPPRGTVENLFTIYAAEGPPRTKIPVEESEVLPKEKNTIEADDSSVKLKDGPVDPQLIREVLELHEKLPMVNNLSYNATDGFGWNDQKNNWNVYFGHRLKALDQKILLYEHIKSLILSNGERPNMISVAFIEAPFYRLEQ